MNVKAKKMLSLVLAFVMVLGMFPATVFATNEAGRFADVPADVWYADAVQYVADNGLMVGVDDNHFAPGGLTTRGMVVTVLHRMEGEPSAEGTGFTDVEDGVWYTEAILWAQENGIVEGYGDGTFHPHASMTREEMMAVFYRYSQYKGYDVSEAASLTVFTDSVKIQSYAEDAMAWAVSVGLIVGFEDGTIRPQADSNRVQLATVLMRFNNSFINKLSITITQDDCTVTEIHHSLGGEFHILNTALQEISCSAQSEEYPDNEYEIGNILIDESQRTWKIEDIRLYPGKNDITVTIVDIFGNQASDCITITYDSDDHMGIIVEDFKYEYDIVIDPGHGGTDVGASNGIKYEKDINLEQSMYEKCRYESMGLKVYMTRYDDTYGTLMGSDTIDELQRRAFTVGYYGVVSKVTYSNHHNASINKNTYGFEMLVSNSLSKKDLIVERNLYSRFKEFYGINDDAIRLYSRDYNTDKVYDKLDGQVYDYMDYYAMIRIPKELYNVNTTIYEPIYMSNSNDFSWYYTNKKWIDVTEIKIMEYVNYIGGKYNKDNSMCL